MNTNNLNNNNNDKHSIAGGSATVSKIGQLAIFNYTPENKKTLSDHHEDQKKKKIHFIFCVDNSGSMGQLSQHTSQTFVRGLIGGKVSGCSTSGSLVTFDEDAQVLAKNFDNPALMNSITFPRQARTNITAGVQTSLDLILDAHKEENKNKNKTKNDSSSSAKTIHTLIFLSDGGHNVGKVIDEEFIKKYKAKIESAKLQLAVIVVGIYANDTRIGMMVKGLENVRINTLDSVYYAKDRSACDTVLDKLVTGLSSTFAAGDNTSFSVSGQGAPVFLENMANRTSSIVDPYSSESVSLVVHLPNLTNKQKMINSSLFTTIIKNNDATDDNNSDEQDQHTDELLTILPQLFVNDVAIPVRIVPFSENDLSSAISALMPGLSQERVAGGAAKIAVKRDILSKHLDIADELCSEIETRRREAAEKGNNKNNNNNDKKCAITGTERARMLKLAKQSRHRFAEERAHLNRLMATVSDNSQEMASFLNGAGRKYAGKALMRSNMVNTVSADTVLASLRNTNFVKELKAALEKDKELMKKRSDSLNDNNIACSIFSLQSALETYQDWIDILDVAASDESGVVDPSDVYSCLVAFSLTGHPVKFNEAAAAQMQPLMTQVLDIDCTTVDTGSIYLARQSKMELKGQMGKKIEQAVAMVDPSAPNASAFVLRKSQINQINQSANICSDLFMCHPDQTFASHVHTFTKCVEKFAHGNNNQAYMNLAIKTLFSFNRIYPSGMTKKNSDLFNRWFFEHSTITTSEEDDCVSPIALPFLLGLADLDKYLPSTTCGSSTSSSSNSTRMMKRSLLEDLSSCRTPLVNLINEWLTRRCKMALSGVAHTHNHANTTESAHFILKKFFSISEKNSPKPLDDVLASEPSIEAIKENTQHWVDDEDIDERVLGKYLSVGDENENLTAESFINKTVEPVYLAFKFARAIQLYFASADDDEENKENIRNWNDLSLYIEEHLDSPPSLVNFLCNSKKINDFTPANQGKEMMERVIMFNSNNTNNNNHNNNKKKTSSAAASSEQQIGPQHKHTKVQTYHAMLAQALLYHDSSSREGVDEHDVADPITLQEMIQALRLSVYFDLCKIKRAEYLSVIGNVSYGDGLAASETQFASMLGVHTHGLTSQAFWGFLKSCANDEYKRAIFQDKSNHAVKNNQTFDSMLNRASRRSKRYS